MFIAVFLSICSNFHFSVEQNVDLIFSLQQNFGSDGILFEKQLENEKIVRNLLKYQESQPKAFVGLLDLNKGYRQFISSYKNNLVIFNGKNDFIQKLVQMQTRDLNVMTSFIWIYNSEIDKGLSNLDLLYIPYNAKFFIVKKINFSSFAIIDVYQITLKTPKIFSKYAVWENDKLKVFRKEIFSNRMNLKGHELKLAGSLLGKKYGNRPSFGKKYNAWELLSSHMNFTIKLTAIENGKIVLKNGTKFLISLAILHNRLDGLIVPMIVLNKRLDHIDFIFPGMISQIKMYVEIKQGLNWKAFITPFEYNVWLCLVGWAVVVYLFMEIIKRIISPLYKEYFEDQILNFISALCSQGGDIKTKKFTLYICALMPYIIGIVLLQHYSADLLSCLTVKDLTPPFTNLEGVINDDSYEIGCQYPSPSYERIMENINTKGQKMERLFPVELERIDSGDVYNDMCLHRRVLALTTLDYIIKVNCSVVELPESVVSQTVGYMVRKGFPYREVMTKMIRLFQSTGLKKLYAENYIKQLEDDDMIKPIGLETVFPAFLLLISFTCLTIIILTLEIIVKKYKMKRHRRRIRPNLNF